MRWSGPVPGFQQRSGVRQAELSHAFDEAKSGGLDNLRAASANRHPKTLLSVGRGRRGPG